MRLAALAIALFSSVALAQVTLPDGYELQNATTVVNNNAGWITAIDCDFTAQPFTPLDGGDGTSYTICGQPWTTFGSANANMTLDAGLVIQVIAAGGDGFCNNFAAKTPSGIKVPLLTFLPSALPSMAYRLSVWVKAFLHSSLGNDYAEWRLATDSTVGGSFLFGPCGQRKWNGASLGMVGWDFSSNAQFLTSDSVATDNMFQVVFRKGFVIDDDWSVGTYDGGLLPQAPLGYIDPAGNLLYSGNILADVTQIVPSINLALEAIGQQTTGPTVTFGRIKLEYRK